ncbi:MAG: cyclic nucleotide-binding domain-containing protein [Cyanobacteriota bacterium]|nr:cyclic nucleotide-binding domain-containing protein [Cyanobacteriota bacterium]
MASSTLITWLQERTALSLLSREVLAAIAPLLEERSYLFNQTIICENEPADGLYILKAGCAESNKLPNDTDVARPVGLLPGSVLNLQSLLLDQPTLQTVIAQNDCELWFLDAASFQNLLSQSPEIAQLLAQNLAEEVAELSSQLAAEQERQAILRPYLVTKAKRGVIGKSRYATRLRKEIKQVSEERQSVLIFGEPGLEKDNIAALIHYGSADRREAIIKMDCSKLQTSGADLFGRAGGKPGLIDALGKGTLILNNIEELPSELFPAIAHLLETGTYTPITRDGQTGDPATLLARVILISEKRFAQIDPLVERTLKVPPLRVRKADIGDWVNYYLSLISRAQGIAKPRVSPEAIRRLQSYDFPNNLRELENLVERATVQLQGCDEMTEEILWPSQSKKQRFRVNLLNANPQLRQFLRSPWWPDRINYGFTLTAFALIVAILFLGPQTRDRNFALNLFWAWWWPLVLLIFPFLGRVWCAVCPFMIYGEVTQKLSLWLFPRQLKRWPRDKAEKWGGWFLFCLFALILLWEELWDLENTAYLSACLLLLITAGAMIFSAIFERRFWCRYLCPIGGMNGMFAKLSMTELRAQQGICSAECTTYQCYKGGPQKGEGLETDGCPLYSHPAQLDDNRDCVLCMTCLKACPHRSVEFNLRPPGIELWTTHIARPYEVALLLLLLDVVFLHHLPEIQTLLGLNFDLTQFWQHFGLAVATLSLPALVPLAARGVIGLMSKITRQFKPYRFVELAYGYLPLVLAGNLAHYLPLGLGEGGRILPVTLATFGLSGEGLPIGVAHPAVVAFLQGTVLIFGVFLSGVVTQKIARQPLRWLLPQHFAILAIGLSFWAVTI